MKYLTRKHPEPLLHKALDDVNHVEKLKIALAKLLQAGLRANTQKSIFCMDTIEYLGYLLVMDDVLSSNSQFGTIL